MDTEQTDTSCMDAERSMEGSVERAVMSDLGFFGHFLHLHAGGRAGKSHVLVKLTMHDGHLTQRELLDLCGISSASLSEVLAKLEAEGLIRRDRSERDRRQLEIALTEQGRAHAEKIMQDRVSWERESLSVLTQDERVQLRDMLDRLRASWTRREEERKAAEE